MLGPLPARQEGRASNGTCIDVDEVQLTHSLFEGAGFLWFVQALADHLRHDGLLRG
ncbi:hypothetical protein D3C86_2115280 [compost metagenome]